MVKNNYELHEVEISENHFNELSKLFESSFHNRNLDTQMLDWQYSKNPAGTVVGYNAYCGSQLAAHYVCIPIIAKLHGQQCKGLLSINTATHPEHQGQGLFTQLANKTYQKGAELGYDFVVGVANQNSVHGFTKKLGFQNLGLLESRLVFDIGEIKNSDYEFARLWTKELVQWRLSHPKNKYLLKACGKKLNVYAPTLRKGFSAIANQVDIQSAPNIDTKVSTSLFTPKLWIGIDSHINWLKNPNIKIPQKFRSVPLTLIYKNLKSAENLKASELRFWAHDFDAY